MIDANHILQEYVVTEKATEAMSNLNQYTFQVHPDATRFQVKKAIEHTFNVGVSNVNVLHRRPKIKLNRMRAAAPGKKAGFKRAIVTLKEGDKIEII